MNAGDLYSQVPLPQVHKNIRYPQWASSLLIMIVIDSPIGSIGSRNVHTPGYPLGPLVP